MKEIIATKGDVISVSSIKRGDLRNIIVKDEFGTVGIIKKSCHLGYYISWAEGKTGPLDNAIRTDLEELMNTYPNCKFYQL